MNEFLNVIRNHYADFTGRARRREYWMFTLISGIISLILYIPIFPLAMSMQNAADNSGAMPPMSPLMMLSLVLFSIYSLAVFVPTLAVAVRRLHDTGKSGWWYLLSFIPLGGLVLLAFLVMDSVPGANKWGPNPKGIGNNQATAVTPTSNW